MTAPQALLDYEQAGGKPFDVVAADAALVAKQNAQPGGQPAPAAQVPPGAPQQSNQPATALQTLGADYVPPVDPNAQLPAPPSAAPVPPAPVATPPALNSIAGVDTPPATPSTVTDPAPQPGQPPAPSAADPSAAPPNPHITDLSGAIQKYTEEGVATLYEAAKLNPDVIDQIAEGGSSVEKRLVAKVLEQHAEEFGAATIDEYVAAKEVSAAEGDPAKETDVKNQQQFQKMQKQLDERDWRDFVKDNQISDELADAALALKVLYPEVPNGRLVHMARGDIGIENVPPTTKENTAAPAGSRPGGAPQGGASDANPAVKAQLGIGAEDERNAEAYFNSIGVPQG